MVAYLLPLVAWAALLVTILRDAAAYDRAHPAKRASAHGAGENVFAADGH